MKLSSSGKSIPWFVITYMGKKNGYIYNVCITNSLCCIPETNTILYVNYTSIKKEKDTRKTTKFFLKRIIDMLEK